MNALAENSVLHGRSLLDLPLRRTHSALQHSSYPALSAYDSMTQHAEAPRVHTAHQSRSRESFQEIIVPLRKTVTFGTDETAEQEAKSHSNEVRNHSFNLYQRRRSTRQYPFAR